VTHLDYPYRLAGTGRSNTAGEAEHARDLIEQVLFTGPGERVNRPDFGCGVLQLVFEPNSEDLAAATRVLIHGSLQRWLADEIEVANVEVRSDDSALRITVEYTLLATGEQRVDAFTREGP